MTYTAEEYARVLYELDIDLDSCLDFAKVLDACPQLLNALDNPSFTSEEKHRVIDRVFDKKITPFLKCLCDNGRISLYRDICTALENIIYNKEGTIEAEFTSAFEPGESDLEKIKAMLVKKYNKSGAKLHTRYDASLLGGFILKVGDTEYDKSLKGAITNMKRKLEWR